MNKADGTAGFFRRRLARARPDGTDYADFGTAFGLDLSLAAPVPPADTSPAPARRAQGWLHRLTGGARRR